VEFAESLREDLARRDFTVNAIAWHALREEFQDPFHGRQDLESGLLRTVGRPSERFSEDYLRVLRALRFSGKFGFRIHPDTWRALCGAVSHLGILSPERVREELMKVLAQDPRPSASLSLYADSGVLDVLYPELAAILGSWRPGAKEEIWAHSLALVDSLSPRRPVLRLTGLLDGIGIPEDVQGGLEGAGDRARERGAALLVRGRFSNAEIRDVTALLGIGLEPPLHLEHSPGIRHWLFRAEPGRFRDFARVWVAKARVDLGRLGRDPAPVLDLIMRIRRELSRRPALRLDELEVNGRDLIAKGLKPGPHFGDILDRLMERVLDDPAVNTKERLLALLESDDPATGVKE
jgi:tRNA nucleotidyltransferase (CCA-adding enzyme)